MMITVLPDLVDRRKAAIVAENTIKLASYPEDDPRHEPVLRGLVESWIAAGCRLDRWEKANPKRRETLNRETNHWTLTFWPNHKGKPLPILSSAGRAEDRPRPVNLAEFTGYQAFAAFLLCAAPRFDVGKCDRCTRFYWNKWGKANKRFCRRRCSQQQTATEGQRDRISRQRQEKNRRIKKAIREFIEGEPEADWKAWVSGRARVTRSYITRAVNRGLHRERDGLRLTKSYLERLK